MVFMGDVGALALGAALGIVAVLVRQELVFMLMGGVFVMETVSVILQVASYKLTGRRIFHMAPLPTNISHGAVASSFRIKRLAGTARHCALLDYYRDSCADRTGNAEDTLSDFMRLYSESSSD